MLSGTAPRPHLALRRSYDLHHHLTTLLVCAVATVVFTRAILAATGYPQVGNAKLHIAHVLYGGLLLLAALVCTLSFLNPATKAVAAVVGGIGFGLFIDEVGKFVTKDVDYFYRPAIAIIYVAFLVLFGIFRGLARRRFGANEAVLIGLETLQRAAVGSLTRERRTQVLRLLRSVATTDPLAPGVVALLESAVVEAPGPTLFHVVVQHLRNGWTALTAQRWFRLLLYAALAAGAAASAAEFAWLVRHGFDHLTFSQRAFGVSAAASDVAIVAGVIRLRTSLLGALHWYDHAVLIQITIGQVFLYTSEQLAASLNLVALLVVWAVVRWGIHFEATAR
jgi:hypothetical protein